MLELSRIRAITLDLDDTLWPVMPTIERAEAVLQAWLAEHAPATARHLSHADTRRAVRAQVNRELAHLAHDFTALRRAAIRLALQQAGVPPEQVLHIGDDAALDVLGALQAGMQTVWLNRDGQPWAHGPQQRPHCTVADLWALCAQLGL